MPVHLHWKVMIVDHNLSCWLQPFDYSYTELMNLTITYFELFLDISELVSGPRQPGDWLGSVESSCHSCLPPSSSQHHSCSSPQSSGCSAWSRSPFGYSFYCNLFHILILLCQLPVSHTADPKLNTENVGLLMLTGILIREP